MKSEIVTETMQKIKSEEIKEKTMKGYKMKNERNERRIDILKRNERRI